MSELSNAEVEAYLSDLFGLSVRVKSPDSRPGVWYVIRFSGVEQPFGFSLEISRWPNYWLCDLVPDNFPGDLIAAMEVQWQNYSADITRAIHAAELGLAQFSFVVNGVEKAHSSANQLQLQSRCLIRFDSDEDDVSSPNPERHSLLRLLQLTLLPLLLSIPGAIEEPVEPNEGEIGEFEGAIQSRNCLQYERSRKNRAICLAQFGYRCQCCGILLTDIYGSRAEKIVHVHHITPVSLMGEVRRVNPFVDLLPLCPNCHAVIHATHPPIEPAELREMLSLARKQKDSK